ncbi:MULTISPECIES: D-hexose-6-phosphate mutarotase [unclassified Streptomyces]|uniref:D-hexose-6-phosphate mutarotase n=1 Tax=unclassified Streptomyces TaxID=2593676 RepID=UPI002E29415C|nr:D-hexose-6-phosphate mutarotase [Streptomyces sp. NBC_01439]
MLEKIFALPVDEALAGTVSLRRLGGLPLLVVDHPRARAAVCLQGAQLVAWQPAGHEPVLWLSEQARWEAGVAVRGGIPICWPWFDDAGEPMHGFARTTMWALVACRESDDGVRLTLELRSSEETRALWPHDFTLRARIAVGRECSLEMEVSGEHSSVGALHTYLRVGKVGGVSVAGLGGRYTDGLREEAPGVQDGPLVLVEDEEIERYYPEAGEVSRVEDRGAGRGTGRVVEVCHREHSDVVVWNPGEEPVPDVAEGAHREFVCVETARLGRPLVSTPSESALLAVSLRVARTG